MKTRTARLLVVGITLVVVVVVLIVGYVSGVGQSGSKHETFAEARALVLKVGFTHFQGSPGGIPVRYRHGWPKLFLQHCDQTLVALSPKPYPNNPLFGFVCDSNANALAAKAWIVKKRSGHLGPGELVVTNQNVMFEIAANDKTTADRWASALGAS